MNESKGSKKQFWGLFLNLKRPWFFLNSPRGAAFFKNLGINQLYDWIIHKNRRGSVLLVEGVKYFNTSTFARSGLNNTGANF